METLVGVRGRGGFPVVVRAGSCSDTLTDTAMTFCSLTRPDSAQVRAKNSDLASVQASGVIFCLLKVGSNHRRVWLAGGSKWRQQRWTPGKPP